ncbi:aldose 1-epimerase [Brevibacillus brevis]|uniref:Aldose 1-epimerase n=1 Tax=Brevibacillus brevis TaxID=1393 RepID=A0ABY9T4F6_BREBE|nr:aldose 1-epimerase [Brevibacillus brevis]WNC14793.1 aldose 1-epimerase [Brevibacillus brevis]
MGSVMDDHFFGERAIAFSFGKYRATLLPDLGGNVISFVDTEHGYHFLREPKQEEMEIFKAAPFTHGIPVLFPPNRYANGEFTLLGRTYRLPVNEPAAGNHLHGFFYDCKWEVTETGQDESESFVVIEQQVSKAHPAYLSFPHEFILSVRYSLSAKGLQQAVKVTNKGNSPMPCLLGFHTALNAPFSPGSTRDDMKMEITIGERWELDNRMLPTGKMLPLTANEQRMKEGGISPYFTVMDHHYTAAPKDGKNFVVLTDVREQVRLIYDVGVKYRHWMIWNKDAASGFFCPEPQTNAVNAPNLPHSFEETGIVLLEPGETWEETSRLYTEQVE